MNRRIINLFLLGGLLIIILSSCTKEEVILEQDYPLDNGKYYQLEGGKYFSHVIYFQKNVFFYYGEGSKGRFSCNYKYVHPMVTLTLMNDTTYQFYVGEDYLKLKDKSDNAHYFYEMRIEDNIDSN